MTPKIKFGSTIILVLLGLLSITISLQVFSSPTQVQEQTPALKRASFSSKPAPQSKILATPKAKLHNPFVPMQLEINSHDPRMAKVSHSQVPNATASPILKGIVEQSGRQFAIIEYNNQSHICAVGNNVSSYTLKGLTAFSAFLEQKNGEVIEIFMGNKK